MSLIDDVEKFLFRPLSVSFVNDLFGRRQLRLCVQTMEDTGEKLYDFHWVWYDPCGGVAAWDDGAYVPWGSDASDALSEVEIMRQAVDMEVVDLDQLRGTNETEDAETPAADSDLESRAEGFLQEPY